MVKRSRTRIARKFADGFSGDSSAKNVNTGSSMLSLPSVTAKPTAVG